ncbi:MAG: hypothetical protein ACK5MT_20840 [Actinomycetales bacterium]
MHNFQYALSGGFHVLWVGLLLGAGLPALFALGIRSLAYGTNAGELAHGKTHPIGTVLAGICFAAVLIGVTIGITLIVASGFGKTLSFEHIIPVLVDK